MATFTWKPDWSLNVNRKPRVLKAQFGDGYSQRTADGINNIGTDLSLTFKLRTNAEAEAIMAFLDGQAGWQGFYYTDPSGNTYKYTCDVYNRVYDQVEQNTITATFTRVFEP